MLSANTAENGKLMYEAGQQYYAMEALSDSGDHQTFTSSASLWSDKSGYSPTIRPDGLVTGGVIIPDNAAVNDVVDISALTCYLAGTLTSVAAGSITCTRPAGPGAPYKIDSICVDNLGALAEVAGTDGGAFSETRGVAGGPPLITVGYIEIGQVRFSSDTSAPVTASEIFQVIGTHQERWDYPLWETNYGPSTMDGTDGGGVKFLTALPTIHVGPVVKGVYAQFYEPLFAEAKPISDFVPPDETHSVASQQVYGGVIGSRSSSLGQGTFNYYGLDGVTDALVKLKNEILWFKFYPDQYKNPYLLCQGKLGVSRTFPADNNIVSACTISSSAKSVEMTA